MEEDLGGDSDSVSKTSRKNWGDSSISAGWKRFWFLCALGEGLKFAFCSSTSLMGTVCGCCTCPTFCACGFGTTGCVSAVFLWIFGILLLFGTVVTCLIPSLIPFIGWIFLLLVLVIFVLCILLLVFGLSCLVFVPITGLCIGCYISTLCPLTGCGFLMVPNPSLLLLIKLFGLLDANEEVVKEVVEGERENPEEVESCSQSSSSIENPLEIEVMGSEDGDGVVPISELAIEYSQEAVQNRVDDEEKFELDTEYIRKISSERRNSSELDVPYTDQDGDVLFLNPMSPPQSILEANTKSIDIITEDIIITEVQETQSQSKEDGESEKEGDVREDIDVGDGWSSISII